LQAKRHIRLTLPPIKLVPSIPLILSGLAITAMAQMVDLSGTVEDSTHALVQSAVVTATHEAMGVKRSTVSNDQGVYRFSFLAPGSSTVSVEAPGFGPVIRSAVRLDAGEDAKLDLALAPAVVKDKVVVTGSSSSAQISVRNGGNRNRAGIRREPTAKWPDFSILDYIGARRRGHWSASALKSMFPMSGQFSLATVIPAVNDAAELDVSMAVRPLGSW
jgi:carboxypeptidase family protein